MRDEYVLLLLRGKFSEKDEDETPGYSRRRSAAQLSSTIKSRNSSMDKYDPRLVRSSLGYSVQVSASYRHWL